MRPQWLSEAGAASQAPGLYRKCKLVTARAVGKRPEILQTPPNSLTLTEASSPAQKGRTLSRNETTSSTPCQEFGFELMEEHRLVMTTTIPNDGSSSPYAQILLLPNAKSQSPASSPRANQSDNPKKAVIPQRYARRDRPALNYEL